MTMDCSMDDSVITSEGEISDSWESENEVSNLDDSLYVPTPVRVYGKPSPIDLPNKLCFFPLPQLGKFLDTINELRSCNTPGCRGNLAPVSVNSKGLGGCVSVSIICTGCAKQGGMFETSINEPGHTCSNAVSRCVQVAFIVSGCTHAVYHKVLKNALGIDAYSEPVFMDTIYSMYPIVESILNEICEMAKQEMKDKNNDELGSWKRAVTVADGTWQTRGWHSKNATFTIRNYMNGALLYYRHLCQKGRDKLIKEDLFMGTSKSAEGYAARETFQKAKKEGMQVAVHWQDADSSSAKGFREVFPDAQVMICGGHAGRAHKKILEKRHKLKKAPKKMWKKYEKNFPALRKLSCKCLGGNHSSTCGCLNPPFIAKAHTNFTSILMKAQSQEEFVRRLKALPYHARDIHEWEGGKCDFHPLRVCTCKKCDKEVKCEGKPYVTRMKLDCEFHALLYEIECCERAELANRLVHPILKRGHSNALEASHNVLIRFRSKDIYLERLHYELSTNLGLLEANLSYMHAKLGTSYHWLPELYRRMKLPVFEGMVEALEKRSAKRKRQLELAKTSPKKKRRIELKKLRVKEGIERSKWSKEHGHDTYFGGSDAEELCDSSDGVNQRKKMKSGPGKGKARVKGKCAACGSSTHLRSSHKDCPFNKRHANKEPHTVNSEDELIASSESDETVSDRDSLESSEGTCISDSDSVIITCTCGAGGRAHKRDCPLSSRNRMSGRTLFPAPSEPKAQAAPRKLETENVSIVKPDMNVGDYVCIHSRSIQGFHIVCRIVGEFAGRYQLYCTKGVLNTSFSCTELISVTECSPLPLTEWRKAPKITLRSATNDTTLHEHCNCIVPETSESIVLSSASEKENEAPERWVSNGAYTLDYREQEIVLSRRGWLTDEIIGAAQMILLQFFPNMAGLQPPTLQKVLGFLVHSGEFVQIIHVRNSHWCVVSTVGCQSGVVRVYDSLYKKLSKETEYLIASMVHVPSSDLHIVMMDVEKQSNGSDCGVLSIAYAFDICSGMDPCSVRFDQTKIRQHLATCLENCHVSRFPVLGDRVAVQREPKTVELHCSCRMPERDGEKFAECDSCHIWYHGHCMDIPSDVFDEGSEVHWECKRCVQSLSRPSIAGELVQS